MRIRSQHILWLDCLGGLFVGLVVLLFSPVLSRWEGLPVSVVSFLGISNIAYGTYSLYVTTRRLNRIFLVKSLAIANMSWLLVCVIIAIIWSDDINTLGLVHVLGEGLYVAVLGLIEWRFRYWIADSHSMVDNSALERSR